MSSSTASGTTSGALPTASNRAPPQGGIIEGSNPSKYNPKDPIVTFIIQASIIIIFCRLLHYPLSRLRQPRVIAEVIGGILLGPSIMGRIPGFTNAIFPVAAMPNLALVANLGLVLFLFLVGLEVDLRYLVSNWKIALSVGVAGMLLPFGFGAAIAWGLYNQFKEEEGIVPIGFGVFMLFIGVAMAITAFPVLCRILTELKLLQTPVGIIVLSAGVGNDVVGWVLLALCVALVNAGSGLSALWVLLACIGYVLFLVYAIRPVFLWVLRRTRSLQDGPSQGVIALTLLIVLASSFFTGIIGVHAIFGAFMAGLICPHEGGFAIKVAEKVEDLVSALFLPLYFALSGLNTNLGLLDSGITWGYVIGVIAVAFTAKFFGAALAARASGLVWRESFTIGSLMSCKGLVELIVLNIGLQARILSTRTFTIFVVMALVTTFATTPLTSALYPPWYQKKLEAWKRGEIDWDTGRPLEGHDDTTTDSSLAYEKLESGKIQRLLVYLRVDNMPNLLAFVALLGAKAPAAKPKTHPSHAASEATESAEQASTGVEVVRPVEAHGVRLLELTERDSSVMKVSELDEYTAHDPVVNTFRTFGVLNNISVSGEVSVIPESSFADAIVGKATEASSDLIILPWTETGSISERDVISTGNVVKNKLAAQSYTSFVASALAQATTTTAVFVNRNFGGGGAPGRGDRPKLSRALSGLSMHSNREKASTIPITDRSHHVFFPFFGGPDDRAALRLVLQVAESADVTATIVHYTVPHAYFDVPALTLTASAEPTTPASLNPPKTPITATSATAPHPPPPAHALPAERDTVFFASLRTSLPPTLAARVLFESPPETTHPLRDALARAQQEVGQAPRNAGDLVVLGRNAGLARAFAGEEGAPSLGGEEGGSAAAKCLGQLAARVWAERVKGSVLVVQAPAGAGGGHGKGGE